MAEIDPTHAALIASATLIAKEAASEAVKDAYQGLKRLIKRKSGGGPKADVVLDSLDSKPNVWSEPLKEFLRESGLHADPDVVDAAKQLMELVGTSQTAIGDHNVQVAGDVGTIIQGGVVMGSAPEINEAPSAPPKPHWLHRSGCPQFTFYRGIDPRESTIGGDARISGSQPQPNSIEVKWEGPGIESEWHVPNPTALGRNDQIAFHMGWERFQSNSDANEIEVRFNMKFWWDNEQCHATWIWYLVPHAKPGAWEWNINKGSGTKQPNAEDTWPNV